MLLAVSVEGRVYALAQDSALWKKYPNSESDLEVKCISAVPGFIYALGNDGGVHLSVTRSNRPIKVREEVALKQISLENVRLPSSAWEWEGDWETVILDDEDSPTSLETLRKFRFRVYKAVEKWIPLACLPSNTLMYGEFFTVIRTGGHALKSKESCHHSHFLWALSNLGKLYWRVGVSANSPEGVEWMNLPAPDVVTNISCGPNGILSAITKSKGLFVRVGVQPHCPMGTQWVEINIPSIPLRSIQAMHSLLCAFDEAGKPWVTELLISDSNTYTSNSIKVEWTCVDSNLVDISQNEFNLVFSLHADGSIYYRDGISHNEPLGTNSLPVKAVFEDTSKMVFWRQVDAGTLSCSNVPMWVTFVHYCHALFSFPKSETFEPCFLKLELMGHPPMRSKLSVYSQDKSNLKWETSFGKMVDVAPLTQPNVNQVAIYVVNNLDDVQPPYKLHFESRALLNQWFMLIYKASQIRDISEVALIENEVHNKSHSTDQRRESLVENVILVQDCRRVSLPIIYNLKYGFHPGASVTVSGAVSRFSLRFEINLDCGNRHNTALHFNPRQMERTVVRNTMYDGAWGLEERSGGDPVWSEPGMKWQVHIICEKDKFKIYVNRVFFCYFSHRISPEKITTLRVSGNTEVDRILYDADTNDFALSNDAGLNNITCTPGPTPWTYPLDKGFSSGFKLILYGFSPRHSQRFSIRLRANANCSPLNIVYHFSDRAATANYIASGYAHDFMCCMPCKVDRSSDWIFIIIGLANGFKAYLNFYYLGFFTNFMRNLDVTEVQVNGDAEIHRVKYGVSEKKD